MNEAQETYLKNYSAVNKIDQMLLHWDLSYHLVWATLKTIASSAILDL